jgi:hypothetical protein
VYLERMIKTMKILRISDLTLENLSHYLPIMKQIADHSLLAFGTVVSLQKVCRDEENGKILLMVNKCGLDSHRLQVCQGRGKAKKCCQNSQ